MSQTWWMNSTSRKLLKLAGILAVVVASCAGYSASIQAGVEESSDRNTSVTIQTFQFRPTPVEVRPGTRVTWTNQDDILHTVTSGTPESRDHRFEAPLDGKGASSTVTFAQAGSYPYFCDRHQSMRDKAKQDKAVADLVQYTQDFGAFLSSANPNLPKDVVADLVKTHVLTLKEVIDVQASGNAAQPYVALSHAASHMTMIANQLADAIAKQFPAKYSI